MDDRVESSPFTLNKDWTIVGDWELLETIVQGLGIKKGSSLAVFNRANGILVFIQSLVSSSASTVRIGLKSLKAICSDGRMYDKNWEEYIGVLGNAQSDSTTAMVIGGDTKLNSFTQMAFKNLGIYNNQLLSKDNCIKAYNYLQTLKAK